MRLIPVPPEGASWTGCPLGGTCLRLWWLAYFNE